MVGISSAMVVVMVRRSSAGTRPIRTVKAIGLNIGAISKTPPFVVLDNKKQTAEKRSAKRFVKLLFLKKLVRQKILRKVLQKEFPERGEPCSFSIRH